MVETAFCSPIKDDITEICAPAACSTGKGRIVHDDLHAFSSDGILFANSSKKYEKMPAETDGFWTSFCVQELLPKFRRSRELAFFYSRCRYIGWLKGVVLLPGESILPSGRTTSFFIWAGAAAGLLLCRFPLRPITNKALESKGNPKTIGFGGNRRSAACGG